MDEEQPSQEVKIKEAMRLMEIGVNHLVVGEFPDAHLYLLASLHLFIENPTAWMNLSALLLRIKKYDAALAAAERAEFYASEPNVGIRMNRGTARIALGGRIVAGCEDLDFVTETDPANPGGWHNRGLGYYYQENFHEARKCFMKASTLAPENHIIATDLAMAYLAEGDIREGISEYVSRWNSLYKNKVFNTKIPYWDEEDLDGKSVIIHHEQGYGDALMLSRFLMFPQLMHTRITLAVPKALVRLFEHSFPKIKVVDWESDPGCDMSIPASYIGDESEWDYHIPMMDLLRLVDSKLQINLVGPCLKSSKGNDQFYGFRPRPLRVGLCWASGDHGAQLASRRREVPLELFTPLFGDPTIELVSLQLGDHKKDISTKAFMGMICDPTDSIRDFLDTANIINDLDLVVSVDSAVAHLAGSLGKPTFMLGPYPRCWRWWGSSDGDPWYGRFNIFQQSHDKTWDESVQYVIDNVRKYGTDFHTAGSCGYRG